jgi:hypothetical protein
MMKQGASRTALGRVLGWVWLGGLVAGCGGTNVVGEENTGGLGNTGGNAPNVGGRSNTGGAYNASGGTPQPAMPGGSFSSTGAVGPILGGGGQPPVATGGYWTGPQTKANKVDLLLVVDNSLSMADKQQYLREAVPNLVERLVSPACVDGSGQASARPATGTCPAGTTSEFSPIQSLHVGIITSSLGAAGKACSPGGEIRALDNDHGHLVGPLREMSSNDAVITYEAATGSITQLVQDVNGRMAYVGEQGCGYESTHEAWYRFLVDPEPPTEVAFDGAVSAAQGVDYWLLAQRAAFLRPDSAVVIVILSDENDCSMIDYGQGWLVANEGRLPRSMSRCAQNPNDRCCISCQQRDLPSGCPNPGQDPECSKDAGEGYGPGALASYEDALNLRCWQTKRRFGFDLLFPITRYVNGLTEPEVCSRQTDNNGNCVRVANPLFSGGRSPSLVSLVGIVGVPWQDIATEQTLNPQGVLELMDYASMSSSGRWDMILGDPNASPPRVPSDPFMQESIDPRSGANPVTGAPIVGPGTSDPLATLNGHEVDTSQNSYRDDLQYACIFELPQAMQRDCTQEVYTTTDLTMKKGCDCGERFLPRNRPLCQPPGGGETRTYQYFAKGYPGLRHLQLLQGLGPRGITGSICPKASLGSPSSPAYGYNAVANATLSRLRQMLE